MASSIAINKVGQDSSLFSTRDFRFRLARPLGCGGLILPLCPLLGPGVRGTKGTWNWRLASGRAACFRTACDRLCVSYSHEKVMQHTKKICKHQNNQGYHRIDQIEGFELCIIKFICALHTFRIFSARSIFPRVVTRKQRAQSVRPSESLLHTVLNFSTSVML